MPERPRALVDSSGQMKIESITRVKMRAGVFLMVAHRPRDRPLTGDVSRVIFANCMLTTG
ncbi:MAG: hypothetical protein ACP5JB_04820 [candidate division WOR-3 bacterium]|jgi:hypothetical protein